MSRKALWKIAFWLLFVISLTLYLNTGWALYSWWESNILDFKDNKYAQLKTYEERTATQRAVTGPRWWTNDGQISKTPLNRTFERSIMLFVWPVILFSVALMWFVYFLGWLFWLMFFGGLAKLAGLG